MQKGNKLLFSLVMGAALMGGATSCDDFEEINFSPSAAGESYIHPDYALMRRKWTRILQNVYLCITGLPLHELLVITLWE